ncbi:MAG: hypothetical protein GY822_16775 [Deltaproteobacteria bacterium]|nr:hypothetical protein [Deltaproteobacteria bacterium]
MSEEGQNRKPAGRALSIIEAELREDEETKKIAETLGLGLDEYIAMVMEYVKDPKKEPELEVYDEEELAGAIGEKPATVKEIEDWLDKVESGEIDLGPKEIGQTEWGDDEETATETRARKAAGKRREITAPKEGEKQSKVLTEDNEAGNLLRDQLRQQQSVAARATVPRRKKKPKPSK